MNDKEENRIEIEYPVNIFPIEGDQIDTDEADKSIDGQDEEKPLDKALRILNILPSKG